MAPLPDFQSLSPKQKEGVYQHVEEKLKPSLVNRTVNWHHYTFAHEALACGATGPDLQPLRDISYEVYGEEKLGILPTCPNAGDCNHLSIPGSCFP
jgi:hypothetical protein